MLEIFLFEMQFMHNFRHTKLGYTNGFTPDMQDVRGKPTPSHCVSPVYGEDLPFLACEGYWHRRCRRHASKVGVRRQIGYRKSPINNYVMQAT